MNFSPYEQEWVPRCLDKWRSTVHTCYSSHPSSLVPMVLRHTGMLHLAKSRFWQNLEVNPLMSYRTSCKAHCLPLGFLRLIQAWCMGSGTYKEHRLRCSSILIGSLRTEYNDARHLFYHFPCKAFMRYNTVYMHVHGCVSTTLATKLCTQLFVVLWLGHIFSTRRQINKYYSVVMWLTYVSSSRMHKLLWVATSWQCHFQYIFYYRYNSLLI